MTENEIIVELQHKVCKLESQMLQVHQVINLLQSENLELRKLLSTSDECSALKRPLKATNLENPSVKKLKTCSGISTPSTRPLQESKSFSENNKESSARMRVMKDIVKNFHSNVLPRYRDHIDSERNLLPKLRGNDGRIILKNIRYIR